MENLKEIRIKSRRDRSEVVKIGFSSTYQYIGTEDKNLRCNIMIGSEIIGQLQWKPKDYITAYESCNDLVLKRNNTKFNNGRYKLQIIKHSFSYMVSIPFLKEVDDKKIRTVRHEIIEMEEGQKYLKIFMED
jgi:hypothetical protein